MSNCSVGNKVQDGWNRTPFILESVEDDSPLAGGVLLYHKDRPANGMKAPIAFSAAAVDPLFNGATDRICVHFVSPVRFKDVDQPRQGIPFVTLVRQLTGRINAISSFHCNSKLEMNYQELAEQAESVAMTHSNLTFRHLDRWSNRQKEKISISGYVGEVCYSSERLSYFEPLLRLGIFAHIGKGTVLGLGQYVVRAD